MTTIAASTMTRTATAIGTGKGPATSAHCAEYVLYSSWSDNTDRNTGYKGVRVWTPAYQGDTAAGINSYSGNAYGNNPTETVDGDISGQTGNTNTDGVGNSPRWFECDTTYSHYGYACGVYGMPGVYNRGRQPTKTVPYPIQFASPPIVLSGATQNSINVVGNWYPNTNESTAICYLFYKKTGDSSWTLWGVDSGSQSGYSQKTLSTTVTGLDGGTSYQFKLKVSRTTTPADELESSIASLSTNPSNPDITTEAASNISDVYARLNGTLDPNTIGCAFSFVWSTVAAGDFANETAVQLVGGDGLGSLFAAISGLTASTAYQYKAKVQYYVGGTLTTVYGSTVTFNTTASPNEYAAKEDLMQTLQFDGQYGQAKTITFTLKTKSVNGSDQYYASTAPTQAQTKIYKNGVYDNTSDNAPAQVGSDKLYTLVLSATEMQAETVDVVISDGATNFRDQHIQVRTAMRLSEIDVDATSGPTDASAMTLIGNGNGYGLTASIAGAVGSPAINAMIDSLWLDTGAIQGAQASNKIQLASTANGTSDYYNGAIVTILSGTGAGQSRVIVDYNGGDNMATVDSPWLTTPGMAPLSYYGITPGARPWELQPSDELTDIPTIGGSGATAPSYGKFLQLLFQRFAYKITQEFDRQEWYNKNSSAASFQRGASDDGSKQTLDILQKA